MKAFFLERPSFPHCHTTWDPQLLLDFLCNLVPTVDLSLLQSSRKMSYRYAFVVRPPWPDLAFTGQWKPVCHGVVFVIGDLLKTFRPGVHTSHLLFDTYPHDSC